jgi:hypothetical protein
MADTNKEAPVKGNKSKWSNKIPFSSTWREERKERKMLVRLFLLFTFFFFGGWELGVLPISHLWVAAIKCCLQLFYYSEMG